MGPAQVGVKTAPAPDALAPAADALAPASDVPGAEPAADAPATTSDAAQDTPAAECIYGFVFDLPAGIHLDPPSTRRRWYPSCPKPNTDTLWCQYPSGVSQTDGSSVSHLVG